MADITALTFYPDARQLDTLNLRRLDNATLLGYLLEVDKFLLADETVKAKMQTYFLEYRMAVSAYRDAYRQAQKSLESDDLKVLDEARDKALSAYHQALLAGLKHPNAEKQQRARELNLVYDKYAPEGAQEYMKEYTVISEMLAEMDRNYQLELAVKALALEDYVSDLKAKNEAFIAKMRQRQERQMYNEKGIVYQTRLAAEAAYRLLVRLVNIAAVVEGDDLYRDFFAQVNQEIEHYKLIIARKGGSTGSGDDAQPEEGESQDGGSTDGGSTAGGEQVNPDEGE